MRLIAVALISSLALAAPAAAQQPSASTSEVKEAKPAKPKRICRTIQNTGMRTAARQCKTVTQWEADEERADGTELGVKAGNVQPN